jgi:HlyD family secretion protein
VTSISNSASSSLTADQVTNFKVKIRILKESYLDLLKGKPLSFFRPGMTATVDIITKTKNSILAVPISAVVVKSDTAVSDVKVLEPSDDKIKHLKATRNSSVFLKVGIKLKYALSRPEFKMIRILSEDWS